MLRQRRMVAEVAFHRQRWHAGSPRWSVLPANVQFVVQVGDGKMDFAIGAVRGRRTVAALAVHIDEGGAEGRQAAAALAWAALLDNLLIAASNPEPRSRRRFGLGCGAESCTNPRSARAFILSAPATPSFGFETIAVVLRGFIADGESGVVVRRADQAIKVCFKTRHMSSGSVIRMAGPAILESVSVSLTRGGHRPGTVIGGIPRCRAMVAGGAHPAKRRFTRCAGQRLVPVDDPGSRLVRQLIKLRRITGDQPDGQAIAGLIGEANRLREAVVTDNRQQRAKVLFIRHLNTGDVDDPGVNAVSADPAAACAAAAPVLPPAVLRRPKKSSRPFCPAPPACSAGAASRSPIIGCGSGIPFAAISRPRAGCIFQPATSAPPSAAHGRSATGRALRCPAEINADWIITCSAASISRSATISVVAAHLQRPPSGWPLIAMEVETGRRAAGEQHAVDITIFQQRLAGGFSALQQVDRPVGDARLLPQLDRFCGSRCQLARR